MPRSTILSRSLVALALAWTATPFSRATAQGAVTTAATVRAFRAATPPVIDGREDDDAWKGITPTHGFRQYDPSEDAPPTFETEFRVAYDNNNLYVLVRAFDPHPDSIVQLLSRRDIRTNSDQIGIIIDGFLDRRNGNQFAVNPAGVKRDAAHYNDTVEDFSWDGVWDVATRVDDKGWVAEFRIPFSQLRFAEADVNRFGFLVGREIPRLNEKSAWPVYRRSVKSAIGQLGTLEQVRGVPSARRVEMLPYVVAKNTPSLRTPGAANRSEITGGLDAKAGVGTNFTIDATVNPDFGQVESDPSILNLTAFETKFEEKRPFFQEGIGLFRCGPGCEGPFYTRRMGRAPQLRTSAADPAFTSLLGAAKVTGRFRNGYTLAVLDAVTREEHGIAGAVIEPQTNYMVLRAARESSDGQNQAGLMITDVRRTLDKSTEPLLRRTATAMIAQATIRFAQNRYELGMVAGQSYVTGAPGAIARTQRSSVHYYQRPDHEERYDSTRTSMTGGAVNATLKKIRGALRFETSVRRSSPGQEMNDLGLIPTVNDMSIRQNLDYQPLNPGQWFRSAFTSISAETHWSTGGLPVSRSANIHTSASLHNNWGGALTYVAADLGGVNCVSCARGGPSLRRSPGQSIRLDIVADPRLKVIPKGNVHANVGDEGLSYGQGTEFGAEIRVASRFSATVTAAYDRAVNDQQWVGNYGAFLSDTTHYTFARLDQETLAITMRMNWTATPALSFQFYGQPFVSAGSYNNWRELAAPRAPHYADRFRRYGNGASPAGFNIKQFNSNAVMRWEYRPTSVLFLVWQQGRFQDVLNRGSFDGQRDVRDLFSQPPENTLLLKVSYWFNP